MNKQQMSGGVGFPALLFLVFLVLKLCGVISWSWWWVTCPMWSVMGLVFVVGVVIEIVRASRPSTMRRR